MVESPKFIYGEYVKRGTSGLHQKLFLISLDGLVSGVKDAYERDMRDKNNKSKKNVLHRNIKKAEEIDLSR